MISAVFTQQQNGFSVFCHASEETHKQGNSQFANKGNIRTIWTFKIHLKTYREYVHSYVLVFL